MPDLSFAAGDGDGGFSESEEAEEQVTTLALTGPSAPSVVAADSLTQYEAPAGPDFVPARTFDGAREGMIFKKGKHGLGYYLDTRAQALKGDASATVTALKDAEAAKGAELEKSSLPSLPKSRIHSNEQTRYFIIKSNTHRNLVLSVENGVWATPRQNEEKFNKALYHAPYVVLIFSVQNSGHFQGYAKMLTPVGSSRNNRIFTGYESRHFEIRWLRLEDVPFSEVSKICNPLNENKSVKVSRDGQELPYEVGRELCEVFDQRVYRLDPSAYVTDEKEVETGPAHLVHPGAAAPPPPGYAPYGAPMPPPMHMMHLPPPHHPHAPPHLLPPWGHPAAAQQGHPFHQPPFPPAAGGGPAGFIMAPHGAVPSDGPGGAANGAALPSHPWALLAAGGQFSGSYSSSSSSPSRGRKKKEKAHHRQKERKHKDAAVAEDGESKRRKKHRSKKRDRRRKSEVEEARGEAPPAQKKRKRRRRQEGAAASDNSGNNGEVPPEDWRGPRVRLTPRAELDGWQ